MTEIIKLNYRKASAPFMTYSEIITLAEARRIIADLQAKLESAKLLDAVEADPTQPSEEETHL